MEIWKDINGLNGNYEISSYGRVVRKTYTVIRKNGIPQRINGRLLRPYKEPGHYYRLNIHKRNLYLHRLLAEHFIPNPNNYPQVNHKDGNKHNNSLENLEWCTGSDNCLHSRRILGNKVKGLKRKNHPGAKPVLAISPNGSIEKFDCVNDLAERLGVDSRHISRVLSGKRKTFRKYTFKYDA